MLSAVGWTFVAVVVQSRKLGSLQYRGLEPSSSAQFKVLFMELGIRDSIRSALGGSSVSCFLARAQGPDSMLSWSVSSQLHKPVSASASSFMNVGLECVVETWSSSK